MICYGTSIGAQFEGSGSEFSKANLQGFLSPYDMFSDMIGKVPSCLELKLYLTKLYDT